MSSLISILSTVHGRLRREQRDISKRDLCKAIIQGRRERCWGQRWKIEYDGIIFIVNNSLTQEVTAYPSPLALAPINKDEQVLAAKTRSFINNNLDRCTSHTVLVVDNSGSMSKHDINLHRDRQVAAYSVTAMEFVAEQLFQQSATNTDVVTLIEFDKTARVVFTKEPFGWELYNKILKRRSTRSFRERDGDTFRDACYGDSNYLPALEAANEALEYIDHDRCALSLLFLSDGAPTDAISLNLTPLAAKRRISEKVVHIAQKFKEKLNIQLIGFGSSVQDFSILQDLAQTTVSTSSGTKAEFTYCGRVADKIGTAISRLVSSTTQTRTHLLTSDRGKLRPKREIQLESEVDDRNNKWNYHKIIGHYIYDRANYKFVPHSHLPPGAIIGSEKDNTLQANSNYPPLLAINRFPYGKGAERIAFRCSLAYSPSEQDFAYNPMVAKETIMVERPDDNIQFHEDFCKAQDLSSYLAFEFNKRLVATPSYSETKTPIIAFLPCSILVLDDPEWKGRGVLVEKKLNSEVFGWRKYNDNAGGLDGKYYHRPLDVERELAKLEENKFDMDDIIEEGSEDESETEDEKSLDSRTEDTQKLSSFAIDNGPIEPTDYIHAFTHFTYLFTNKRLMVCDLQGVYNSSMVPPVFELTDPAIHYKSKTGKRNVYGRTDSGEEGIELFFNTHRCNRVCKILQLSKRNKQWKQAWKLFNEKNLLTWKKGSPTKQYNRKGW